MHDCPRILSRLGRYRLLYIELIKHLPINVDIHVVTLKRTILGMPNSQLMDNGFDSVISRPIEVPGVGGWYLRNFGHPWTKTIVKIALKKGQATFYVHPWEVSDNRPNLEGIPFHVFRRTGRYVRDAIRGIVKDLKVDSITIRDFLEKECLIKRC